MKGRGNPVANLIVVATAFLAFGAWLAAGAVAAVAIGAIGTYVSLSPRLLKEWERGVLLRLGRFQRVLGPGINWTFPGFDRLVSTVDMRIRSTPFQAEKTLTKDTVPVNVDAVLFWVVTDARKAIVEVEHYAATVSWAAQTTLRDVIGHTELVGMISDREQVDRQFARDLWHFDPRWVLGDERYQGHGAVPHLRSTNIPGYDQTMSGVAFDPSLGRASYVVRRSGGSVSVRRFNAHTLAAAERRRAAQVQPRGAAAVGWQLRPFWRFR